MSGKRIARIVALSLLLFVAANLPEPLAAQRRREVPLMVGWHDELNRDSAHAWNWNAPLGRADQALPKRGLLRLTLGNHAQKDRLDDGRPYYWASAARYANVDLDKYPILAVRVPAVRGPVYWDVILQQYRNGESQGAAVRATAAEPPKPGLLLFDVPEGALHLTGRTTLRIRLNVGGTAKGGAVDYAYVRFVRRADAARLAADPDLQQVTLAIGSTVDRSEQQTLRR
jgi:hypothetical protein